MTSKRLYINLLFFVLGIFFSSLAGAKTLSVDKVTSKHKNTTTPIVIKKVKHDEDGNDSGTDVVEKRIQEEEVPVVNPFVVSLYQPNYLLPAYYTFSPYDTIYQGNTPENQKIQHIDVKFQFSIKVPIITRIFHLPTNLYIAYTQMSYWQAYNSSPFFRESNYEPAVFLANNLNWHLPFGWQLKFINLGAMHQSNGRGGDTERSWNRLYSEIIFSKGNWMIDVEPWYIFNDSSRRTHNPNIADYLGHGVLIIAYKYRHNTFSLRTYNNIESGFHRGTFQLSWSFPITKRLRGYAQYFNGFGQSMLEYDHRTANSIGVGLSISDWI